MKPEELKSLVTMAVIEFVGVVVLFLSSQQGHFMTFPQPWKALAAIAYLGFVIAPAFWVARWEMELENYAKRHHPKEYKSMQRPSWTKGSWRLATVIRLGRLFLAKRPADPQYRKLSNFVRLGQSLLILNFILVISILARFSY